MFVYLDLLKVQGRENDCGGVLWFVSNKKVSVTASYIMGKCPTVVFVSVFCNVRGSMGLPYDGECLRDNAVFCLNPSNTLFYPCERAKSV